MARPTEDILWAESAAADDVSDPSVERPGGFQFRQDLPNDQLNFLLRALGRWTSWTRAGAATPWGSLPEAIAETEAGDVALVDVDPATSFFGRTEGLFPAGDRVVALDVDGRYAYLARRSGSDVFTVEIRALEDGALIRTLTLSGTPDASNPVRAISADGAHVGVVWGERLDLFDLDGTRQLEPSFLSANTIPVDVYLDGQHAHVLVVGDSPTVVTYPMEPWGGGWSWTPAGSVISDGGICSDGRYLYATYSTSATDYALALLDFSGPILVTVLDTYTWSGTGNPEPRGITCDGEFVYVATNDPGARGVRVFRVIRDTISPSHSLELVTDLNIGALPRSVAVAPGLLMVTSSAGEATLYLYHVPSFEQLGEVAIEEADPGENDVCTDGLFAYTPGDSNALTRTHLGGRVRRWRRCDGTEAYRRPFHNLLIPGV